MENGILILVHPGSLCGSADFNLGDARAGKVRKGIITELSEWKGGLLVLDGELSDELHRYRPLDVAITAALKRSEHISFAARFDPDDFGYPEQARDFLIRLNTPSDNPIILTGAWHHPDEDDPSGCVNATMSALLKAGFSNVNISEHAAKLTGNCEDEVDVAPHTGARKKLPRP